MTVTMYLADDQKEANCKSRLGTPYEDGLSISRKAGAARQKGIDRRAKVEWIRQHEEGSIE